MFIGKFKNDKPFPDKLAWNRGDQITYDQVSSVCVNDRTKVYFWGVLYNRKSEMNVENLSDAAIIAEMYERSGDSGFSYLDGSFTFIVFFDKYFSNTPSLSIFNSLLHIVSAISLNKSSSWLFTWTN